MANNLTLINEELKNKVRSMILEDKSNKEIQEALEINPSTWENWYWNDYRGFRCLVDDAKDRMRIRLAERVSEKIMKLDAEKNTRILSIQQKEAEFLRERLDKSRYSARIENTGKDGATPTPIINIVNPTAEQQPKQEPRDAEYTEVETLGQ